MKKIDLFKKIDALYTKATKAIIGDTPIHSETTKPTTDIPPLQTKLQTFKILTKNHIQKVKKIGLKASILTLGEPEEKDVLYKEVVKREKQEAKAMAKEIKEALKAAKVLEKEKKSATKKALTKKSSVNTKKVKTKKTNIKKPLSVKKLQKEKENTPIKTAKSVTKKDSSSKKKTSTQKGAKRAVKIALYTKDIKKHYGEVDEDFLAIIVKNLGPSIYKKNAELVSCSDPKELDTVRKNFLIKKLGMDVNKDILNAAIQDVCKELKASRHKYRATFYYSLAKKFKKESALS